MEIVITKSKKPDKKRGSRIDGNKNSFIWTERCFRFYKT